MGKKVNRNLTAIINTKGRRMDESSFIPQIFANPYNDNDYDILEDLWAHTIAGKALDVKIAFAFGDGIKPTFELKDPTKGGGEELNEEQKSTALDKFSKDRKELERIDKLGTIRFNRKAKDTARKALVFGRAAIVFEPNGRTAPLALKTLHSRDMGRVFVHQLDWSLSSMHAFQRAELIKSEDMIYFVNMADSPRRRSMWYGFSELQRVVGQARALRKIQEVDMPEVAETLWAGYGLLIVDNEGLTGTDKITDQKIIGNGLRPGAFNIINGKKDEISFQSLDTNPKIAELIEMARKFEQDIIGNSNIPGPLMGREEEANMATLYGKIRLFIRGPIKETREWISDIVSPQWYEPNLGRINRTAKDTINVNAEFEPVIIESWIDNIDALLKLRKLVPSLPDEEILRLADLDILINKLDPERQMTPEQMKDIGQQTDDTALTTKMREMFQEMKTPVR